jgi:hypothetical protein
MKKSMISLSCAPSHAHTRRTTSAGIVIPILQMRKLRLQLENWTKPWSTADLLQSSSLFHLTPEPWFLELSPLVRGAGPDLSCSKALGFEVESNK